MEDGKSLQERVREAKTTREGREIVRVPIPGYKGMLVGVYGLTDWQTRVEINIARQANLEAETNRAEALWELAADHLLASSQTVEAVDGEEREDLQLKLGRGLAAWLGLDLQQVETDRQALAVTIEDGEDLISHFGQVLAEQGREGGKVDQKLVGESEAVS